MGELASAGVLRPGQSLVGGSNKLTMTETGNLDLVQTGSGRVLWTAHGEPGSELWMQADGNLVLHNPGGTAAWSSNTSSEGSRLWVLDAAGPEIPGGNVVIVDQGGVPVWTLGPATGHLETDRLMPGESLLATDRLVSSTKRSTLDMQRDGNLVLRRKYIKRDGDEVVWSAAAGSPQGAMVQESALVMQHDGVLALYPPGFAKKTRSPALMAWKAVQGKTAPWVRLVDDGHLEFLDGDSVIGTIPSGGVIAGMATYPN